MGDNNTQQMMTYNETRLTVSITDLIISEGFSFNISEKPRFKNMLYLEITMSKIYQPSNIKAYIQGYFGCNSWSEHGKELDFDKKESAIFGLLFLYDGATIYIISLLNILVSGKILQYLY